MENVTNFMPLTAITAVNTADVYSIYFIIQVFMLVKYTFTYISLLYFNYYNSRNK